MRADLPCPIYYVNTCLRLYVEGQELDEAMRSVVQKLKKYMKVRRYKSRAKLVLRAILVGIPYVQLSAHHIDCSPQNRVEEAKIVSGIAQAEWELRVLLDAAITGGNTETAGRTTNIHSATPLSIIAQQTPMSLHRFGPFALPSLDDAFLVKLRFRPQQNNFEACLAVQAKASILNSDGNKGVKQKDRAHCVQRRQEPNSEKMTPLRFYTSLTLTSTRQK